jgi:Fibronectin type III-like domain
VENTGSVGGLEVPQVYVGPPSNPPSGVQFALQKLVGFKRVQLNEGDAEYVSVHVSPRELSYWSTAHKVGCWLGASARSASARLHATEITPKSFDRATRLSSSKSHAEVRNLIVLEAIGINGTRIWCLPFVRPASSGRRSFGSPSHHPALNTV